MDWIVTVHLAVAIALVLAYLVALISLLTGGWSDRVGTWMGRLAGIATAQWILGFFVWFMSISDGFNVFTALIHPLAMTGVLGLSHVANGRAKSTPDLAQRVKGARTMLIVIGVLLILLVPWAQVFGSGEEANEGGVGGGSGLANPASTFCVEQGGQVEIVDEANGQVGYCVLSDGQRIEEWEYYRSMNPATPSP